MRLHCENGLSFKALDFDFTAHRLCQLSGPNGSGKSNLTDSLFCALFGKTSKSVPKGELVLDGAKSALFSVEYAGLDGAAYRVERRFSPSETVTVFRNGEDLRCYSIADAQAKINASLMDETLFCSAVLYAQEQTEFFVNTGDKAQKGLLESILQFQRYTDAQQRAKAKRDKLQDDMVDIRREAQDAQVLLDHLQESTDQLKERLQEEQETKDRQRAEWTEELEEIRANMPPAPKELEQKVKRLDQALNGAWEGETPQALERKKDAAMREVSRLEGSLAGSRARLKDAKAELATQQGRIGKPCPTCSAPLTKAALESTLDKLSDRVTKVQNEVVSAESTLDGARRQLLIAEGAWKQAKDKMASLEQLNADLAKAKTELASTAQLRANAEEKAQSRVDWLKTLDEPSSTEELLVDTIHKAKEQTKKLSQANAKLTKVSKEYAVYDYWVTGFGNSGIKSLLLDQHAAFINTRVNDYLERLTDGRISAHFSTQKRLKTDELRDKIEFTITIDGRTHDYKTYSGGQKTVINLSAMLALRELAQQFMPLPPLLILDETFKALDPAYSGAVLSVLRTLSKSNHVYVVSHNDTLHEHITDVIRVSMGADGVTRLS